MLNSIAKIIQGQRRDTRNKDTSSIPDKDFVRFNQYAQDRLVGLITLSHPWVFIQHQDLPVTVDETTYQVTDNLALGTRITNVEYSFDGAEANFKPLTPVPDRYQRLTSGGRPRYYKRVHGAVEIEPMPKVTEGTLRIYYERRPDTLDTKRFKVTSVLNKVITGTDPFTGSTMSTEATEMLTTTDEEFCQYISMSNFDGTPILYAGKVTSVSTTTITLENNVSTYLRTGYAAGDMVGAIVTCGKYSVTHSSLPDEAEEYFNEYVNRTILGRDLRKDLITKDAILQRIEKAIVDSFKVPDKDVKRIPISDWNMMIPGYE